MSRPTHHGAASFSKSADITSWRPCHVVWCGVAPPLGLRVYLFRVLIGVVGRSPHLGLLVVSHPIRALGLLHCLRRQGRGLGDRRSHNQVVVVVLLVKIRRLRPPLLFTRGQQTTRSVSRKRTYLPLSCSRNNPRIPRRSSSTRWMRTSSKARRRSPR